MKTTYQLKPFGGILKVETTTGNTFIQLVGNQETRYFEEKDVIKETDEEIWFKYPSEEVHLNEGKCTNAVLKIKRKQARRILPNGEITEGEGMLPYAHHKFIEWLNNVHLPNS